jgi:hypothetical protein
LYHLDVLRRRSESDGVKNNAAKEDDMTAKGLDVESCSPKDLGHNRTKFFQKIVLSSPSAAGYFIVSQTLS